MAASALSPGPVARSALRLSGRRGLLMMLAGVLALGAYAGRDGMIVLGLGTASATLLLVTLTAWIVARWHQRSVDRSLDVIAEFLARDISPSFLTDAEGAITYANLAAQERFSAVNGVTLASALSQVFANPGSILFRLRSKVSLARAAQEDIVTRRGHVRLSAHFIADDRILWRYEDLGDRASSRSDVVNLPMLTVGRNDAILFMNEAARRYFGERAKTLDRLFPELPVQSGRINRVNNASGLDSCLIVELPGSTNRREIYVLPAPENLAKGESDIAQFDSLPVPLLKLAPDGALIGSNRLARDLLGIESVDGRHLSDLMEGLGRSINDWLADSVAGRGLSHSEFLRLSRNDIEAFVQVTLKRVTSDGEPALIAVLNDATELKSLEAQFVQSQKMQAIGQLAGGVAHDFNNLLTAISGHCDLLLLRHDPGDLDFADLSQISQNANRAAALVNQLLAFSRKQTLQPEVIDVRDTLSDLTHLLNRLVGETVTLSLGHDPVLPSIRADKRQLEQVLMNLVVNGRDAMSEGGEIRIDTETINLAEPLRRDRAVVAPGQYVLIKVSDQGSGIPPELLPKVFEPFFTTKPSGEGTGLGLSTAYGIVKQSGGFIFVDSVVNQGTVFTLLFPVQAAPVEERAAMVAAPEEVDGVQPKEGVILLVEDEAPVRAFASRALRMRGHTVLEAESAEAALKTLEEADLAVDVFVTDVVMPGKDGPAWVREALKTRPDVRIVFVSGYAEDSFSDTQARIPNSVFLPKPFSLNELTETVQRQLNTAA